MNIWKEKYLARAGVEKLLVMVTALSLSCLIVGGSNLPLDYQQGRHPPGNTEIDIMAVSKLTFLDILQNRVFRGTTLPISLVAASPLTAVKLPFTSLS